MLVFRNRPTKLRCSRPTASGRMAFVTEGDAAVENPLHNVLQVEAPALKIGHSAYGTPREILKPANTRLLYDVKIEPVEPMPDTPFEQYRESHRRYEKAVETAKALSPRKELSVTIPDTAAAPVVPLAPDAPADEKPTDPPVDSTPPVDSAPADELQQS